MSLRNYSVGHGKTFTTVIASSPLSAILQIIKASSMPRYSMHYDSTGRMIVYLKSGKGELLDICTVAEARMPIDLGGN